MGREGGGRFDAALMRFSLTTGFLYHSLSLSLSLSFRSHFGSSPEALLKWTRVWQGELRPHSFHNGLKEFAYRIEVSSLTSLVRAPCTLCIRMALRAARRRQDGSENWICRFCVGWPRLLQAMRAPQECLFQGEQEKGRGSQRQHQ